MKNFPSLYTNKSINASKTYQLKVGRNRLIPEYTFMDPRGIGLWDMQQLLEIEEAVWALDHDEAGKFGYVSDFFCFILACSLVTCG